MLTLHKNLYYMNKESMQFKSINNSFWKLLIPHAVWFDINGLLLKI